jgi:hypothetical protein
MFKKYQKVVYHVNLDLSSASVCLSLCLRGCHDDFCAPTFMQLVIVVLEGGDVARQVKHMARICSGCLGSNNLLKPSASALVSVGA